MDSLRANQSSVGGGHDVKTTDTGIESSLIDLSTISFARLRALNSTAILDAMHHTVERTGSLRDRKSGGDGQGERVD